MDFKYVFRLENTYRFLAILSIGLAFYLWLEANYLPACYVFFATYFINPRTNKNCTFFLDREFTLLDGLKFWITLVLTGLVFL